MNHHSNSFAKPAVHKAWLLTAIALGTSSANVWAKEGAHVHGAMQMNVAVQAQKA